VFINLRIGDFTSKWLLYAAPLLAIYPRPSFRLRSERREIKFSYTQYLKT